MLQGALWGKSKPIVSQVPIQTFRRVEKVQEMPSSDPRPDLKYDSTEWEQLLAIAAQKGNSKFAWLLHGFRCGGLRLHRGAQGYVFRPDYDPASSMWHTKPQYYADRNRWLVPWEDEIIACLDELTKQRSDES